MAGGRFGERVGRECMGGEHLTPAQIGGHYIFVHLARRPIAVPL